MRVGEKRNAHRVIIGEAESKRQLGRPRHRWKDDIQMCPK
jgi:hypothetical protein